MTNTTQPMTFEEWYATNFANTNDPYHKRGFENAWQASQEQQAIDIEALKHDLYSYMEASNGYVNEIMKQAQTIAELVEALEECLREHGGFTIKGQCERKAREAIAKVKGK